jgi:hypothetical protein
MTSLTIRGLPSGLMVDVVFMEQDHGIPNTCRKFLIPNRTVESSNTIRLAPDRRA